MDELPSRRAQIASLRSSQGFDRFIVGEGPTDSLTLCSTCTQNLKTAPVQGDDFSSGTSSQSTKLIHGGVRYLQKAIMKLDYIQGPGGEQQKRPISVIAGNATAESAAQQ
ncbi:hypothetical protein PAMP_003896 [Pampus punctatissimus]